MATKTLEARIAELKAEIGEVRQRMKPLIARERELENELGRVESRARAVKQRERVQGMVGQEVRHSEIVNNAKLEWINDCTGRLVEVGRKYAVVDFGEPHGKWRMPIDAVYAVDDPLVGTTVYF